MSVGFRVFTEREMPDMELVEKFRDLPTANVCDCMERLGVMHSFIRLLSKPKKNMAGTALTVKTRNGDNLMIHEAINLAGPGDVIVVDNEGGRERSLAGAIMFGFMQYKGVEGFVVDGPVRDYEMVCRMDWPLYATGITSRGPYKQGPGEVNVPVNCGGVVVNPGDIILGDMDGVLVIPRQEAAAVLEKAVAFARKDEEKTVNAPLGKINREWVTKALQEKQVEIINGIYGKNK
ncbi:RraA family protein [Lachnospiraceae bacterium 62-35]